MPMTVVTMPRMVSVEYSAKSRLSVLNPAAEKALKIEHPVELCLADFSDQI